MAAKAFETSIIINIILNHRCHIQISIVHNKEKTDNSTLKKHKHLYNFVIIAPLNIET